jgi:aquacobalamin reductase/NAD(P)H-flavin reductase
MQSIECKIHALTPLTDYVYKVLLAPATKVTHQAGQYLNFVMSDEDKRPFSIASAPNAEFIELQIGAFGEDGYAMQVIDRLKSADTVTIEMPMGEAYLRENSERPVLLVAGGTGFSYIKSMFEALSLQKSSREVKVYWGLREHSACYELEKTTETIAGLENGRFIPVLEKADEAWQGKLGLVHQVVMDDHANMADYDIYIAGRFDMVGILRDDFIKQGAQKEHMFADAFAFI